MQKLLNRPHLFMWRLGITAVLLCTLFWLWQNERRMQAAATTSLIFSPPEGHYQQDLAVIINGPPGAVIFTTDGSTPTLENGALYERPIPLRADFPGVTVFTARILLPDGTLGPISRATYFMLESQLPILSLATDPANLWDDATGLYVHPQAKGREWERPVDVTYLTAPTAAGSRTIGFHIPAGMRIHGNSSRLYEKKSARLYFRSDYGLSRLDYPILEPFSPQLPNNQYQVLVIHNGGQDFARPGWTLLRAHLVSDLANAMHGYPAQTQPVLYFLNGELQGIYLIRNHLSDRFFHDVHGIDIVDETTEISSWDAMWHFMAENDLRDPANYAYVQSQIDIANFIDYNALQFYIANTDWVATNEDIFRANTPGGRWRWAFWDVDWSFGLTLSSDYDVDTVEWFYTSDRPGMDRGRLPLRSLLENPDFRQQFLSRTADLLNTYFAPDTMTARIEALAAELRPDIGYETGRWPDASDWEGNVAYMLNFVHYRPDYLRQHLVNHFGLPGTAVFQVTAPAQGKGQVAINGTLMPPDWAGVYFQETVVTVTAVPAPGYQFTRWQAEDLPQDPNLGLPVTGDQTFTPIFTAVDSDTWQPGDVQITAVNPANGTIELLISRRGGLDLRGWHLTDNDTITSTDEGTFTFPNDPTLADLPSGTHLTLSVIAIQLTDNRLSVTDNRTRSDRLATLLTTDLHLGPNDNLALLTPDQRGIDFASWGQQPLSTPYTFGILQDGVTATTPTLFP